VQYSIEIRGDFGITGGLLSQVKEAEVLRNKFRIC
jgi:hypothetical protein